MRFDRLGDLLSAAPLDLGESGWWVVDAAEVDAFLAATGSGQRDGTVPPLMLLSLTNRFLPELLQVPAASSGVNYGADSVRFGPPLAVGSAVSSAARLMKAERVGSGVQTTVEVALCAQGTGQPACEVLSLSRWWP